ncbi:MAG: hypothetical protein MZU91_14795 [Desulfosudis oleivorans]|nr:hypothetical protein [Desulfosudis oleivorans]
MKCHYRMRDEELPDRAFPRQPRARGAGGDYGSRGPGRCASWLNITFHHEASASGDLRCRWRNGSASPYGKRFYGHYK